MIADRKIGYGNGNVPSREKIFKDYHPLLWHCQLTAFFNLKLAKQFKD